MTKIDISPDLAARRIIVAAYLYYVLDMPTMSDAEYDKLSVYVSENWDQLDPDRQWALGNPQDTRSGGSHIKFSSYAVFAARRQFYNHYHRHPHLHPPENWLTREDGCHYVTVMNGGSGSEPDVLEMISSDDGTVDGPNSE